MGIDNHAKTIASSLSTPRRFPCRGVYGPQKASDDRRVARVLYAAFVSPGRHDGHAVARKLGISYPALAAYWSGRNPFPRHLLGPLYAATGDLALLGEIIGAPGVTMVASPAVEPALADVRSAAIRAATAAGELAAAIDHAVSPASEGGEEVTSSELARCKAARDRAAREIEAAHQAIERRAARDVA